MTGRYKTSQTKNRSRFYILLSVVFVFVLIKWGIPGLINVLAGGKVTRIDSEQDVVPPQPPILSGIPESTNSAYLKVEGFTEGDAEIELLINDVSTKMDRSAEDGSFSMQTVLTSGQNRIQVKAKDRAGNVSQSEVSLVTFDNKQLKLSNISPRDGAEFVGSNNQTIEVSGEINKSESQVLINNSYTAPDRQGKFVQRISLQQGSNPIAIVATDRSGNTAEMTITVNYVP